MFDFEGLSSKKVNTNLNVLRETNGGVAQLGEHLPCKQGVMGSNPIISTRGKKMERGYTAILNGLIAQVVRARA